MSVHNLNDLKQAKILVKEIEFIRGSLKNTFKELHKYKKYVPVKTILNDILSAEVQLKVAETKYKAVLKTKGQL